MKRWTQLVHPPACPGDKLHANNQPIYQTATFSQETTNNECLYDYSRSHNPNRTVLEQQIAILEKGHYAYAFSSGMAAINAILGLLKSGDHLIAGDDLYGGTHRLLSQRLNKRGITITLVDTTNPEAINNAFTAKTRMVLIETPSNPLQKITNIRAAANASKLRNVKLVVDNTFLSPWLQQPLLLGADIVVHSATKHLGGHSDLTAGVVITNDSTIANEIAFIQNAEGAGLSPFDAWLLLKGIKTLGLRIERAQTNAERIANYLITQPLVKKVYYPGLITHSGYEVHKSQTSGAGTVISFACAPHVNVERFIAQTKLFLVSVSFGSLTSMISLPSRMSHASVPKDQQQFEKNLIRLSIGIEDVEDLIADLEQAFLNNHYQSTG